MAILKTYSFLDVQASIDGPGGSFSLSSGAGDDGITVAMKDDKNIMTTGAAGGGMHTLHAATSATISLQLLKTSPVNGLLSGMYALQTNVSGLHGTNVIVIHNPSTGERVICSGVAFMKFPDNANGKDAKPVLWTFHALEVEQIMAWS